MFEREPLGWSSDTLSTIAGWLGELPGSATEAIQAGLAERGISPLMALWFLAVGVAIGVLHILWDKKSKVLGRSLADRYKDLVGGRTARFTAAVAVVALSCLVPLVFWTFLLLLDALVAGPNPLLSGLTALARIYLISAVVLLALREALGMEVLYIRTSEVPLVATTVWSLVLFVTALRIGILLADRLGGAADVLAFLRFLLHLGILLGLCALFLNRRLILANLPTVQNKIYRAFLRVFHRVYYFVFLLSVCMGGLWLAGYVELARLILVRSWAVLGVFLGLLYLDHAIRTTMRVLLSTSDEETEDARESTRALRRAILHVVRGFEWAGGAVAILALVGLLAPVVLWLSQPLISMKDQDISGLLLLQVLGVLVAVVLIARLVEAFLNGVVYPKIELETGIATAITTGIKYLLILVGGFLALETAGLDLTTLKVFAGALGIGVGLGLQRIASNLASGMIIIFGRIMRQGDIVTVADSLGQVREIGVRSTVLKTMDNIEHIIPNEFFVNERIINWTYSDPLVRVHLPLGVSYGSDPEKVRDILLKVGRAHDRVRRIPAPSVWFTAFGDSSLNFELLVWTDVRKVTLGALKSDLYFAAFKALKEEGVEIPFPQRDLHLRSGWQNFGASPPAEEAVSQEKEQAGEPES